MKTNHMILDSTLTPELFLTVETDVVNRNLFNQVIQKSRQVGEVFSIRDKETELSRHVRQITVGRGKQVNKRKKKKEKRKKKKEKRKKKKEKRKKKKEKRNTNAVLVLLSLPENKQCLCVNFMACFTGASPFSPPSDSVKDISLSPSVLSDSVALKALFSSCLFFFSTIFK